ncbi:MAG: single-stranded-DNA-specific exonuclease RecJ [Lachnospiraceae bacterium]|nr:single-stranded-DNA-specific exonuclease RecJ [Lachnospiraceae bacterium]
MEQWILHQKSADFQEWASALNVDPLVAKLLRNRGITDLPEARSFLYGTAADQHDPFLMKDMDLLTDRLLKALQEGHRIRVMGDYDVDGVTSTYILVRGLRLLGADADAVIPHRIRDGYGLNRSMTERAAEDGIQVILTCDNGIAASDAIARAVELGVEVLVTDHHQVPYEIAEDGSRKEILPPAAAVVDPHRKDCPYPYKEICGAMIAYKVMQAMKRKTEGLLSEDDMDEFLQFAALGTVCDVMPLMNENRNIVRSGIESMKHTRNTGLRSLMRANALDPGKLSCYSLGFVLGPCINATGRLESAHAALELLLETNERDAILLAEEIKSLNDTRKELTQEGTDRGIRYVEEHHLEDRDVYVIYLPGTHESIAGIIAGKLRERYAHPVFVLTDGAECVKGSGRSIDAYHMFEHMTEVKDLFLKFGGHALAAGLSMKREDIPALEKALNERSGLTAEDFRNKVYIDAAMPFSYATKELAEQLQALEPVGTGNPTPLFALKGVHFLSLSRFGEGGKYLRFTVRTAESGTVSLTYFGDGERFEETIKSRYPEASLDALERGGCDYELSVTYEVGLNTYRGETKVQFLLRNVC